MSQLFKHASKYGTNVMKDEEVLIFVNTAIENGSDVESAIHDMKMIDALLQSKRLHLAVFGHVKYTKNGNIRKGTHLYATMEKIVEGRMNL